jgi:hypothetical protein
MPLNPFSCIHELCHANTTQYTRDCCTACVGISITMSFAAGDALSVLPVRCLQPQLQLDPVAFCNSCCQLASQLGLQPPQLPGQALLLRATKELALPQVGLLLQLLLLLLLLLK